MGHGAKFEGWWSCGRLYPIHEPATPTDSQIDSICIAYACYKGRDATRRDDQRRIRVILHYTPSQAYVSNSVYICTRNAS